MTLLTIAQKNPLWQMIWGGLYGASDWWMVLLCLMQINPGTLSRAGISVAWRLSEVFVLCRNMS